MNGVYDDEKTKNEQDELEHLFNKPSANDEDLTDNHPSRTKNTDNSDNTEETSYNSTGAQDELENLFNFPAATDDNLPENHPDRKNKTKNKGFTTKKKGILVGLAGLLAAGGFAGFTFLSGPLQVVHIAQLLQQFHFVSNEDTGDDRMSKIARFIRYKNDAKRTRLGILGDQYAERIERKFNAAGIESAYTDRLAYFDGYAIDPLKIPDDSPLADLQNKTPKEIQTALSERYKIPSDKITINFEEGDPFFGKVRIPAEEAGLFRSGRGLIVSVMEDAGFSKVTTAIRSRIMGKRGGVTWHPIKRADRAVLKAIDARFASWRAERQSRINNGEQTVSAEQKNKTADTDGDGNPDSPDASAADTEAKVSATVDEAAAAGAETAKGVTTADGAYAKLRASITAKIAAGVSAAIGIACLVKGISDNIDNIQYLNVALPLTRLAMENIALGNQVMTGQDLDIEQVGFYVKQLSDPESGSWAAAQSIQAELGDELTGPDIGEEAKLSKQGNIISNFMEEIPFIDTVCSAANSALGQVASFTIDIISGPVGAVIGQGISRFAAPALIDKFTHWVAGNPIDINVSGANYGNYTNYGARLAANDVALSSGGVELSPKEVAELDKHNRDELRDKLKTKSFADRMLNPYESYSLVSNLIDKQNPDLYQNTASLFTNVLGNLASMFKSFSSIFAPKVAAATAYDYGFPEYGFSIADLNNSAVNNPMENANTVAGILNGSKGDDFISRAKSCFNIKIDKSKLTEPTGVTSEPGGTNYIKIPQECKSSDTDWLRVRMFILDTQTMEAASCYEANNTGACQSVDFSEGASASTSPSPTASAGAGLNGYVIPCNGQPAAVKRLAGPRADWSGVTDSGTIGANSDGQPIKVYVRAPCDPTNAKTIVVVGGIHGTENGGGLVAWDLLFNARLPGNVRIVAVPELNGWGINNTRRVNKNGVDLNRNEDFNWGQGDPKGDCSESSPTCNHYQGPSVSSEPETKAIDSFLLSLGKVDLFVIYHDNLSYVAPVGSTPLSLSNKYASLVNMKGQGPVVIGQTVTVNQHGSLDAWFNKQTNTPSFLIELSNDQSQSVIDKHVNAFQVLLTNGSLK